MRYELPLGWLFTTNDYYRDGNMLPNLARCRGISTRRPTWQDEALSVATHKPQVYIDLSGWSPKYFPANLVQYSNTILKRKVLFGSDFPVLTPDRWLADFAKIDIRPEVRPLILKENAARLLGLA